MTLFFQRTKQLLSYLLCMGLGIGIVVYAGLLGIKAVVLSGVIAALLSRLIGAPWWWNSILGVFPLLVWGAWHLHIPSEYYLIALVGVVLLFGSGSVRRAPLFLSGQQTWSIVASKLPRGTSVLDAGCGFAGLLHYLQKQRTDLNLVGMELAWLPFIISWCRSIRTPIVIQHRNFWKASWEEYDVVFVFLSPDPMSAVWEKFQKEMKAGSWLISFQFLISEREPDWVKADSEGRSVYGWLKG